MRDEPNPNPHACFFYGFIVGITVPVFPGTQEYISLRDLSRNIRISYLFRSYRCANHLVALDLYKPGTEAPLYSTLSSLPFLPFY